MSHPGLLSLAVPLWVRHDEYPAKAGKLIGTPHDTLARICGLTVLAGVRLRTS